MPKIVIIYLAVLGGRIEEEFNSFKGALDHIHKTSVSHLEIILPNKEKQDMTWMECEEALRELAN